MLDAQQRKALIDTAAGRAAPDLVLLDARVINVFTREVLACDIAIKHGYIASVMPTGARSWPDAPTHDLRGLCVSPGFIDPHVHVESSMVTLVEYARAAMARGVTAIAIDPHEIGNVFGILGMKLLLEEAQHTPLRVFFRVPGRIPAMPPWLETSGASVNVEETIDMLEWPEAVCLAGDINPMLLVNADEEQLDKITAAITRRMTVAGQSPGLSGTELNAYIASGAEDSHVAGSVAEIIENQRLGLRSIIALRRSLLHRPQLRELASLIRNGAFDTRYLQFCTDDVNAHELFDTGHLDTRIRIAIEEGMDPFIAYQMATSNVAEGLRIDPQFGAIAPGRVADLVVIGTMNDVDVRATMIDGTWVHGPDKTKLLYSTYKFPDWSRQSIRLAGPVTADDLTITIDGPDRDIRVRTIRATMPKGSDEFDLSVIGSIIYPDPEKGVSSIAVIDRHTASGRIGRGFVSSVFVKKGALASTVSHDAHNLMTIGANHADMALAVNRLAEIGGGYTLALDGKIIFELPLPIAGLMSEAPAADVADKLRVLVELLHETLGMPRADEQILHHISFLQLPNIPDYGFTDFGLVSTRSFSVLDVIAGPSDSGCGCPSHRHHPD